MYADAETLWKTTLRLNPDSWLAHNNIAAINLERGNADEALSHYQKAAQINPRSVEAQFNLGNIFLRKGRADDAITQYQTAVKINPRYAAAQFNLGAALAQKGRLDDAIAQYQKALQTNPGDARGHLNLALTLLEKGRTSEVAPHFQKALELGPEKPQILNSVAWTLATCSEASLRNGGKAVQLAQRANDLDGGRNPATLRTLAAAFAEAGRFGDAMSTAQKAMELARTAGQQDLAAWLDIELNRYKQGLPLHP
jgi:tetratricopeptide (TPR) repeat protein